MVDGFLGTRASFMLDFVAVAMIGVVPVLSWSIVSVRRKQYALHRRIQLGLGLVLLAAVMAFEVDVRFFNPWRPRAVASPYYGSWLFPVFYVHLAVAISTTVLWIVTIVLAVLRFPSPPRPSSHSRLHKTLAPLAAGGMYLTAVTGWTFYWLAFVAE